MAMATDSFNRANGAIGNLDTGETWSTVGTWTVASNQAAPTTTSAPKAYIDKGQTDITIEVKLTTLGAYGGIMFRGANNTNFYVFCPSSSKAEYRLYKVVNGTRNSSYSSGVTPTTNDIMKIVLSGNSVKLYINNNLLNDYTMDSYLTGTLAGLYCDTSAAARWDDFSLTYGGAENKNGTVAISNSSAIATTGKAVNRNGTVAIENEHEVSVTGKEVNKNGTVEILSSNSISVIRSTGRSVLVAFSNSNSVSVTGKKDTKSSVEISHSNSILDIGRKGAKTVVSISNGQSVSIIGRAVNRNGLVSLSNSNSKSVAGKKNGKAFAVNSAVSSTIISVKKGAKSLVSTSDSHNVSVIGEKTFEESISGVVSIVNYYSTNVVGRKSSRAPPVSITGAASVNVTGKKNLSGILPIGNSHSVSAAGRKNAKVFAEIYGASSNSADGRKAAKGTVSINNTQAVLVTGVKAKAGEGIVSITDESSLIVTGQKGAKKTVAISHSDSVSAEGRKDGKTLVIINGQAGGATGATKASIAEILISNHNSLQIVGIRSSVHKPYEVLFELIERRMIIDLGVAEGGVEIALEERIAILEVEEWRL